MYNTETTQKSMISFPYPDVSWLKSVKMIKK